MPKPRSKLTRPRASKTDAQIARIAALEERIARLEERQAALERTWAQPLLPAQPWSIEPVYGKGCRVCGIGADGQPMGYVCNRVDCPSRFTYTVDQTYIGDPPAHLRPWIGDDPNAPRASCGQPGHDCTCR